MRYRIRVSRLQIAERTVRALDEEDAAGRIADELAKPYGFVGTWETIGTDVDITPVDDRNVAGAGMAADLPLLLSVRDAAVQLGVSRGVMYELVASGEVEHLRVGRRLLISRDALHAFIDTNARAGR